MMRAINRNASMRLLFLQLPRLDPDVTAPGENLMPAAACLQAALERSPEGPHWEVLGPPTGQDTAPDAALLREIATLRPDAVSFTCYLWNIERTLHLARQIKRRLPPVRIVMGGPEIAAGHPLLPPFTSSGGPATPGVCKLFPADSLVVGEGEPVFPKILAFFRTGRAPDLRGVFWRRDQTAGFAAGTRPRPSAQLRRLLPAPDHPANRPDASGMAYLETHRGCPMRCAFCCYNLRRTVTTCLPPEDVAARLRVLRARGAREIRLVDPTFNAHPRFDEILAIMAAENRDRAIAFFVEIRADTLTENQAARLAAAGVAEAEVGIQSTDPAVLKILRRPLRPERMRHGIDLLLRHGIRPTLDFMYALPRQDAADIRRSLDWLARYGDAIHPQFLPTLLLPGTELRDRAAELGLRAQRLPPYRVRKTDVLSARQLAAVEVQALERLGGFDSPTRRFVGARLPDLFPDRIRYPLRTPPRGVHNAGTPLTSGRLGEASLPSASSNRQALILSGPDLYSCRETLAALIRERVRAEPHILWQFVLCPENEEPLDLLDFLIGTLASLPPHWLDRLVSPPGRRRLCARRLFVRLPRGRRFDPEWVNAAEALLASRFH
jgi:radical SAM superfamily enzyme YgiQ (UPF0313 family)